MSIPDYQSLMLPVLSTSLVGEIHIRDVVERLAKELGLTPEERAELLPSGKQAIWRHGVPRCGGRMGLQYLGHGRETFCN
jgi:restriction system protein